MALKLLRVPSPKQALFRTQRTKAGDISGSETNDNMPYSINHKLSVLSLPLCIICVCGSTYANKTTRCNLLFAAFAREEHGRLGSYYFWEHLPVGKQQIKAMINLDMLGSMRNDTLFHITHPASAALLALYREALSRTTESIVLQAETGGLSDHQVFVENGVPVFYLTTGPTATYHSPRDTVETIHFDGMEKIFRYLQHLIALIDQADPGDLQSETAVQ